MPGALGRRTSTAFPHIEQYPLTAATVPASPVPIAMGVNWYSNFDSPVKDSSGKYWIGRDPNWHRSGIRGGHCTCLQGKGLQDLTSWWDFYNQGAEGACVGFGFSRVMTLLNRKRYGARWLWDMAKATDAWPETNPGDDEGTSVHAAADILRLRGHVPYTATYAKVESDYTKRDLFFAAPSEGIAAVRWARNAQDALAAVGTPERDYFVMINSWGRDYPHFTRVPAEVIDTLIREDGEFAVPTDR